MPLDTTTVAAEGAAPPRRPLGAEAEESSSDELQAQRAAVAASIRQARVFMVIPPARQEMPTPNFFKPNNITP